MPFEEIRVNGVESGRNIWLPTPKPLPTPPEKDEGKILIIIPTSGKDKNRLERCIHSLRFAALGIAARIIVVVSPECKVNADVQVVKLPGPFNYVRSLNAGLAELKDEGYVLFLNDDCYFKGMNDLKILKDTLRENKWCCVGPFINQPFNGESSGEVKQIKTPLIGACVLWSAQWIKKLLPLDEKFGEGYGGDESDLSIQALHKGGVWGVNEAVIVDHEMHATFGVLAQIGHPFREHGREVWRRKWGVDPWGKGIEWNPLPGCHVVMTGHNIAEWLPRSLESVEKSLQGFRWVMSFVDDASTDDTYELACAFGKNSSADRWCVQRFPKAKNAAQAKNRALNLQQYPGYPATILMDCDDVMEPGRLELLHKVRNGGYLFGFGDYQIYENNIPLNIVRAGVDTAGNRAISPCSTIIHSSLITEKFFDERLDCMEDAITFGLLAKRGVQLISFPGIITHQYHQRKGSVMHSEGMEEKRRKFDELRKELNL
jgi:glycosyltransferase involved in cell wall biosynthesis